MQLDIFENNRDTMLRNDVLLALERHEADAARQAWQTLVNECPRDGSLGPLARLIGVLERRSAAPFASHDAARAARVELTEEAEPAARQLFGDRAGLAWIAPLWREAAQRAAPLPFSAERQDDHAAPLWLRAGEWPSAAQAVVGIESWRRIPAPLAWMAEARGREAMGRGGPGAGLQSVLGLLTELAWLSASRFDAVTKRLADPALDRLRKKFDADFDADLDAVEVSVGGRAVGPRQRDSQDNIDHLAWFPAWVLTDEPGWARWLGQAQPSLQTDPERGMRLMLDLLALEHQGRHHDIVPRRKQLRDLQPSLFRAYMRKR